MSGTSSGRSILDSARRARAIDRRLSLMRLFAVPSSHGSIPAVGCGSTTAPTPGDREDLRGQVLGIRPRHPPLQEVCEDLRGMRAVDLGVGLPIVAGAGWRALLSVRIGSHHLKMADRD